MRISVLILFCLFSQFSLLSSSVDSTLIKEELKLDSLLKSLRNSKDNRNFKKYNDAFKLKLKSTLKNEESFRYAFDSLRSMSKIYSPDSAFRLFNWNVESESGVHSFYCFILKKNGTLIELRDNHRGINQPEFKSLTGKNWYGAVYYEIIPMKRGKYTLLGWNGKDGLTTQKIMETMSVSRRSVKFGLPYFEYPNDRMKKKRIILRYSNEAYVPVKYYSSKKQEEIVFAHLSPSTPQMKGFYQYYYPDESVDKFILTKGKWLFTSNSKMNNPKSKNDNNYNPPE